MKRLAVFETRVIDHLAIGQVPDKHRSILRQGDEPFAIRGNLDLRTRFNNVQIAWDRQISNRTELDVDVEGGPIFLDFGLGLHE